ncbi:MAG: ferritin [Candidatus Thorarchaeota archaeon]
MCSNMALISKEIQDAFNDQIGKEIHSGYLYLSASLWLKENSYNNLSHWFFVQYEEEMQHAFKIMNYVVDVGGHVTLPAIPEPRADWQSVKDIVESAYAHEQVMTKNIHNLVTLTENLKDYNPRELLQWFVSEQIEEESSAEELVRKQVAFNNDMLFDQHTSRAS